MDLLQRNHKHSPAGLQLKCEHVQNPILLNILTQLLKSEETQAVKCTFEGIGALIILISLLFATFLFFSVLKINSDHQS